MWSLTCFHRASSHACLQMTVIVWCLMCCTVVARLLHQLAQILAGLGMAIHVHDNSCVMLHGNSSGTIAYGNSRVERGHEDQRGRKPSSMSIEGTAWRLAVKELASVQQASGSMHDKAQAGRVQSSSLRISQEVDSETGCVVTVSHLPSPDFATQSPGPGWELDRLDTTGENRDVWGVVVPVCLAGRGCIFCSLCSWRLGKERTVPHSVVGSPAFFVSLLVFVWARHSSRATTGERCWSVLSGLWRAIAPMMKPWCAERDVPAAADLNLYWGWKSQAGWHSDDEPLFGVCVTGEAHCVGGLWDPRALQMEGYVSGLVVLARAGLIMVIFWSWLVNARTSFSTVRIPFWNRHGFRWIRRHVDFRGDRGCVLFANLCGGFLRCCYGVSGERRFWEILGARRRPLCIWECQPCWFTPACLQNQGCAGVPIAGHARWTEVGGSIISEAFVEVTGFHLKCAKHFLEVA